MPPPRNLVPSAFGVPQVINIVLSFRAQNLSLSQDRFLSFLFGSLQVSSLSVAELLDLSEILSKLKMKRVLLYLCWHVSQAHSLKSTFDLFQKSFGRFEDEIEDPMNVKFQSALSSASFLGLQRRKEEVKAETEWTRWLMRNLLWEEVIHGGERALAEHPQLVLTGLVTRSQRELRSHVRARGGYSSESSSEEEEEEEGSDGPEEPTPDSEESRRVAPQFQAPSRRSRQRFRDGSKSDRLGSHGSARSSRSRRNPRTRLSSSSTSDHQATSSSRGFGARPGGFGGRPGGFGARPGGFGGRPAPSSRSATSSIATTTSSRGFVGPPGGFGARPAGSRSATSADSHPSSNLVVRNDHPPGIPIDDCPYPSPANLLTNFLAGQERQVKFPNVELRSKMDQRSFRTHIELLLTSYEFFRLMMRGNWSERDSFNQTRVIELEDLSSASLRMLAMFAYVGRFSGRLVDLLLLLRHAERTRGDGKLIEYTLNSLKEFPTAGPSFLSDLADVGNVFENLASKREIVRAWAGQGAFTEDSLMKKIGRAAERAKTIELSQENEVLRDEVKRLSEMMEQVMSRLAALEARFRED